MAEPLDDQAQVAPRFHVAAARKVIEAVQPAGDEATMDFGVVDSAFTRRIRGCSEAIWSSDLLDCVRFAADIVRTTRAPCVALACCFEVRFKDFQRLWHRTLL